MNDFRNSDKTESVESLLEARYSQFQHLQAIGTLAGGIAHDFNNILFGIQGYAELALSDASADSAQADHLNEILSGCRRAKELVHQILAFSRQDSIEKIPVYLTPLVKETAKLLRASIPSSIDIRTRFASDLPRVDAKPNRIHQIIMNLCTNAAQSIGDAPGIIRITLDLKRLTPGQEPPDCMLAYGDYVCLAVEDDGRGIPDASMDHIFEPFFTTKAQGKGVGMGLSVVHGIVQTHQGQIFAQNLPGKGARFEVWLPTKTEKDISADTVRSAPAIGSERIMYVDDEKALGLMMKRMLTSLGYDVTVWDNPAQALVQYQSQPHDFDLVITDLTMPQMNGLALAENLLRIRPNLPVLLCTGYGDQIDGDQYRGIGIRELVHKPVTKLELAAVIRRAIHPN